MWELKWVLEDFDYQWQCFVIVAIGDTEEETEIKGSQILGEGYETQCNTRLRQIYVQQ